MKMHRRKKHLKITTVKTVVKRSEEHTSELQSQSNLVCRLLLEKKKENNSIAVCKPCARRKSDSIEMYECYTCDEAELALIFTTRLGVTLRTCHSTIGLWTVTLW